MAKYSDAAIQQLCERLQLDCGFFMQCLEVSTIEIRETEGHLDLDNGSALRLRRLERLCHTFHVEVPIAELLLSYTHRIAELESELQRLPRRPL